MAVAHRHSGNVNPQMLALTPSQVAALPPDEQANYMNGLSPYMQGLVHSEARTQKNRRFMRKSVEKTAYCPVTGGSGVTATYTPGNTLYFDFPTVPGFAKGLLITFNLTVNPATGTAAAYALNAAAPWNIFSELQVLFNGPQVRTHPYLLKILDQLKGHLYGQQNDVLTGNKDATIEAQIVGTQPITVNTNNVWKGKLFLPLNAIGNDTVPGLLPTMGVGNKPQLKLTCVNSFLGPDPLLSPIATTGGTGAAVTATGTVNVDMIYLDGTTMDNTEPLNLDWQNEPTLQYIWDTALTPFAANIIQRQTISTKLEHYYVISIIIDGVQSTSFATLGNLTGFELGPDQVGQQTFVNWNISNNVSIYDFMDRFVRRPFGQDLDEGVIPWVAAPGRGIINASNRDGSQVLNMYPGGYPAATHAYQVGAVSSATITPRVETFLISKNNAGLRVS